jgi:hemerythrin-like domain-containing protein
MIEHRLIERMLDIIRQALTQVVGSRKIDPFFVDIVVDFIRIYADRTHHGKEEEIFFRDLERRVLSETDRRIMHELIEEHAFARQITNSVVEGNSRYRTGDPMALADIASQLRKLVDFYPKHIEKEDKVFFPASRAYFSDKEEQSMIAEFREFDRKMIHDKYKAVIAGLEAE